MEICKQQSDIEMRHLPAISIYGCVGGKVSVATFFLGQSIGIDDNYTFKICILASKL